MIRGTSDGKWTIRRATPADAPGMVACLRVAFDHVKSAYTPDAFLHTTLDEQSGEARLRAMDVFVAIDEGSRIVGTIACRRGENARGEIRGMAVLPDARGTGIADALLEQALEKLRDDGCLFADLGTTELLQRAIRFYEKHGFRRTGKVDDYFGMQLPEFSRPL